MRFIPNEDVTDPRLNLALEEYVVRHFDPEPRYLLFYVNEPSVIIGKNQNTLEEINHRYVEENDIHVVRRISGGGTVYHDRGNLNFSFLGPHTSGRRITFAEFTEPVVRALRNLGVPAELTGRNDIVADGRKISGNAQFASARSMFSHGTLLFDSDLDEVVAALDVSIGKIESKGLKSVRSRVANITEFLAAPMTLPEFRQYLIDSIYAEHETVPRQTLSDEDWRQVRELAATKYGTWEWNFGESPDFNLQKKARFVVGEIDLRLDVHDGIIRDLRVFGDFLGTRDVAELEDILRGCRYEPRALAAALEGVDLVPYFGLIEGETFLKHLY